MSVCVSLVVASGFSLLHLQVEAEKEWDPYYVPNVT